VGGGTNEDSSGIPARSRCREPFDLRGSLDLRRKGSDYVPWSAVYVIACTNACGVLYREDVPADLCGFGEENDARLPRSIEPEIGCAKDLPIDTPWLHSVPAEAEKEIEANGMVMQARRRRRPQLRVVK
jgi:hypothetical protein